MRLYCLIGAALLGGCATPKPAVEASNFELCEYTMGGGQNATVAQAEVNRRKLDCTPLYPAILAKRQNEAAALNNAAQYFNRRAAPQVTCQTIDTGFGTSRTTCR